MPKYIPYLDGWRGLAILSLLIGHFFPVPGINLGTVGVALFFVLSGFLMVRVLFVQRLDFGTFYRRRVSRVFPSVAVYIVVVVIAFAILDLDIAYSEIIPAITFTNNYISEAQWSMPFGHIWSLSVEEHSYVLLSIAAYWCRRRNSQGHTTLALILTMILLATAFYSINPGAHSERAFIRTEVASFGIFVSGFIFLAGTKRMSLLAKFWVAPASLVVGVMLHWWSVPTGIRVIAGWGALAVAINAMPHAPVLMVRFFESSWLRRLGMMSFSMYLWQQPFYQLVRHNGLSPLFGLVLGVAGGMVAFYLIESPARAYLNKKWATPIVESVSSENASQEVLHSSLAR